MNTSSDTLNPSPKATLNHYENVLKDIEKKKETICDDASALLNEENISDYSSKKNLSCGDYKAEENINYIRNKAACVIGAYVKGYLTRRLKKTERVQTLIVTLQETLVCAVQLQIENDENIRAADVELHRRLIQQV